MRRELLACITAILGTACGPAYISIDAAAGGDIDGAPPIDSGVSPTVDTPPRVDSRPPVVAGTIYAHTAKELYKVDSETLAVTQVAPFGFADDFLGSQQMTDIALDRDGKMMGVGGDGATHQYFIYSIDKDTAACTKVAEVPILYNGLSFVPAVKGDTTGAEILVATAQMSDAVVKIATDGSGAVTPIGNFGGGMTSSGDLVSVQGLGVFATVVKPGATTSDYLVQVDVCNSGCTGAATPIGETGTGFTKIWGVGFWGNAMYGNKVYGFTGNHQLLHIDTVTGVAEKKADSAVEWWGAGVFSGVVPFED